MSSRSSRKLSLRCSTARLSLPARDESRWVAPSVPILHLLSSRCCRALAGQTSGFKASAISRTPSSPMGFWLNLRTWSIEPVMQCATAVAAQTCERWLLERSSWVRLRAGADTKASASAVTPSVSTVVPSMPTETSVLQDASARDIRRTGLISIGLNAMEMCTMSVDLCSTKHSCEWTSSPRQPVSEMSSTRRCEHCGISAQIPSDNSGLLDTLRCTSLVSCSMNAARCFPASADRPVWQSVNDVRDEPGFRRKLSSNWRSPPTPSTFGRWYTASGPPSSRPSSTAFVSSSSASSRAPSTLMQLPARPSQRRRGNARTRVQTERTAASPS
mmetsp:Transcript_50575/g.142491  ORF Transcript_50575/g.142491 Transcript_50575/m.142491 type:complete len:330 (+) Transcript_50575:772-1761(+)